MKRQLAGSLKRLTRMAGYDLVKATSSGYPPDFDASIIETVSLVKPYTMTSPERVSALCDAVRYLSSNDIAGDVVECGVWKGGSMMAVAHTLRSLGDTSRELYLFDTYEGMPEPSKIDVSLDGDTGSALTRNLKEDGSGSDYCMAPLDEVRKAVESVGYPAERLHFVKGRVEDTLPAQAPLQIALLRLDTDWYESTRHELIHLYPRLVPGGVLIIDDYGHWQGARQAVDEYIQSNNLRLLLNRVDYTGRIGVKCG